MRALYRFANFIFGKSNDSLKYNRDDNDDCMF